MAVERATGAEVTVVATKPRLVHAVVEGRGLIEFTLSEDGETATEVAPVEGLVDEAGLPRFVSELLGETVDAVLSGDSESMRNRLRDLAMIAKPGGRYLFSEECTGIRNSLKTTTYWRMAYNANRAAIRRSVYGAVREEESQVPKARYAMYDDASLVENRADVAQSIAQIVSVLRSTAEQVGKIDRRRIQAEGWDADKMLDSMFSECTLLADHGAKASELARTSHLPALASIHDDLAEVAKDAVIMRRFVTNSVREESV